MQCAPYITAMVMGVPMIKKMISIVSLFFIVLMWGHYAPIMFKIYIG